MAEVTELTMVGGSIVLNDEPTVDASSLRRWCDEVLDEACGEQETTLYLRVFNLKIDLGWGLA
jgi:hypothetical protein